MKSTLIKLFSVITAFGISTSAYSITIVPTFDTSITSATNAAAITNCIYSAIGVMQSNYLDNVTVNVTFVSDETVGLGQSSTYGITFPYLSFITALRLHAASSNDFAAISKLPVSATDPVIGGTNIYLTTAQARVLGLSTYSGMDSTVSCKMSLMNFTRPGLDPNKYDLQSTLEHELDEVLGCSSGLPSVSPIYPADLFRYTTNLVRTYTTNGDNAYFSPDGTNLVARYNMDPGGDYGDWWSVYYPSNWSPIFGVVTNNPQVQDAFGAPGSYQDLGVAELTVEDVVGWTVASTTVVAKAPSLKIVSTGTNHFTLSWTNTASGYSLQERTSLTGGSWVFSSTGSTNPAVITSTNSVKFYRLYKPGTNSQSPEQAIAVVAAPHGPLQLTTHNAHHQPSHAVKSHESMTWVEQVSVVA